MKNNRVVTYAEQMYEKKKKKTQELIPRFMCVRFLEMTPRRPLTLLHYITLQLQQLFRLK